MWFSASDPGLRCRQRPAVPGAGATSGTAGKTATVGPAGQKPAQRRDLSLELLPPGSRPWDRLSGHLGAVPVY